VSLVFQTFALLPWLTVQQNVELGLEAQGLEPDERSERAVQAIDLIGLDGLESAYYSNEESRAQLETAIDWARYAELFEYDAARGEIRLHAGAEQQLAS
jgi:ABC-type Fe3+/spermidine/putrescine transport system ATPase subunit